MSAIRLYTAHAASGLSRLADHGRNDEGPPPYWAFPWAGGTALARYILDTPATVAGRRVLDIGTGGGIVAIAAAIAGAAHVLAVDTDAFAVAAARLNARLNGVAIEICRCDPTAAAPPLADVVTAGDLFYDTAIAARTGAFLDRCLTAGADVLIGDPGRAHLPLARLRRRADYPDIAPAGAAAFSLSRT